MGDNIINWQIKEYNKMEKTFREVIADIKEGEVWGLENGFEIKRVNEKIIMLSDLSMFTFTDSFKGFKLQRKQYTFEEAFKAYEEGEEIESCASEFKYKKINSVDKYYDSSADLWMPHKNAIHMNEIRDKWYINN